MNIKTMTSVAKIGNSMYVLIPKYVVKEMNLTKKERIIIEYEHNVIKLKK